MLVTLGKEYPAGERGFREALTHGEHNINTGDMWGQKEPCNFSDFPRIATGDVWIEGDGIHSGGIAREHPGPMFYTGPAHQLGKQVRVHFRKLTVYGARHAFPNTEPVFDITNSFLSDFEDVRVTENGGDAWRLDGEVQAIDFVRCHGSACDGVVLNVNEATDWSWYRGSGERCLRFLEWHGAKNATYRAGHLVRPHLEQLRANAIQCTDVQDGELSIGFIYACNVVLADDCWGNRIVGGTWNQAECIANPERNLVDWLVKIDAAGNRTLARPSHDAQMNAFRDQMQAVLDGDPKFWHLRIPKPVSMWGTR